MNTLERRRLCVATIPRYASDTELEMSGCIHPEFTPNRQSIALSELLLLCGEPVVHPCVTAGGYRSAFRRFLE